MKKSFILIALITLLAAGLFISCNVDGDNGLYMKAANSIAPSGINIVQFVGYDEGTEMFYFLSDDGLYKTALAEGGTVKFAATAGKKFNAAYTKNFTEFYLLNNDGKLYKFDGTVLTEDETYSDTYIGLSFNGYLYNASKFIYLADGSSKETNITTGHPMFSGKSMLYMDGDTARIYNGTTNTEITVSGFDSTTSTKNHALGFYEITAGIEYLVTQYDGNYITYDVKKVGGTTTKTRVNLQNSLGYPQDYYPGGYPMVQYADNMVLIKTSSTYYKLNYGTPAKQDEIGTWASSIKDLYVVYMHKLADNKIAIFSVENGIIIVDLANRKISEDILSKH